MWFLLAFEDQVFSLIDRYPSKMMDLSGRKVVRSMLEDQKEESMTPEFFLGKLCLEIYRELLFEIGTIDSRLRPRITAQLCELYEKTKPNDENIFAYLGFGVATYHLPDSKYDDVVKNRIEESFSWILNQDKEALLAKMSNTSDHSLMQQRRFWNHLYAAIWLAHKTKNEPKATIKKGITYPQSRFWIQHCMEYFQASLSTIEEGDLRSITSGEGLSYWSMPRPLREQQIYLPLIQNYLWLMYAIDDPSLKKMIWSVRLDCLFVRSHRMMQPGTIKNTDLLPFASNLSLC